MTIRDRDYLKARFEELDIPTQNDFEDLIDSFVSKESSEQEIVDDLISTDTDKALSANQGKILKDELDSHTNNLTIHRTINDSGTSATDLYSAQRIQNLIATHESVGHNDLYYTETELDAGQLDNRYYTETEIDNFITNKADLTNSSQTITAEKFISSDIDISDGSSEFIKKSEDGGQKYLDLGDDTPSNDVVVRVKGDLIIQGSQTVTQSNIVDIDNSRQVLNAGITDNNQNTNSFIETKRLDDENGTGRTVISMTSSTGTGVDDQIVLGSGHGIVAGDYIEITNSGSGNNGSYLVSNVVTNTIDLDITYNQLISDEGSGAKVAKRTSAIIKWNESTKKFQSGYNGNLNNINNIKDNDTSVSDPSVSDDDTAGYSIFSRWINTTSNIVFMCLDNSTGAAVWNQVDTAKKNLNSSTNPSATDDETEGYEKNSIWINSSAGKLFICKDATYNAASWQEVGSGGGASYDYLSIDESSSPYTISGGKNVILVNTNLVNTGDTGLIDVYLPVASGIVNTAITIKNIGTGTVTIYGSQTGENIDGNISTTLSTQYESLLLFSDGTEWHII